MVEDNIWDFWKSQRIKMFRTADDFWNSITKNKF